jgi:hypothetical protein
MPVRLFVTTVAIILAGVRAVSGQTSTADGVTALARGDYQRAVEILKPLAENWQSDDTAAQFFMAGLYETGRGVPADPLRACALYVRAASKYESPFGRQASALFQASLARGLAFNQECQLLANVGFDNGFEPATFHLGPGHFVEWTLVAATVTYEGKATRQEMPFGLPGARFLPLQYRELATGPTRSLTRHFVEMFVWDPAGTAGRWTLLWLPFEVVRDQVIGLDPLELVTLDGDAPPFADAFDVRGYAVLRVDDEGHAERAVLKGSHRSTRRIESEAERRETREEALVREAGLKGVDWSRKYDVSRRPAMTYIDADGCGDIRIYGWTADRAEVLVVRAAGAVLAVPTGAATFDVGRQSATISIEAHVFDTPQRRFDFCSHLRILPAPGAAAPEIWRAIGGTITIEMSPPGIRAHAPHLRRATVTLNNLVLQSTAGTSVRVLRPVRLTAIVGSTGG